MIKQDFMDERRARWQRLELVTRRLEASRMHRMAQDELDEFVVLYRAACSDLARARSEELGDDVEMYLNDLVARGHKQFRPPASPDKRGFIRFFTSDFPKAVRAHASYVLVATLLFVVPTVISAWAVVQDPDVAYSLSDPAQLEMLTEAYAEGHQGGRSEGEDSMMAGFYVYNNVGVAFKCFAMGVFFGLGSIFFLVLNGVFGGAVGAYICVAGYSESFLSFVIGHGSFELTAIVLSGAIGLRLGKLLVNPGEYTRMGALKVHGRSMINVIMGCAAMLLVAAGLEGFWSPSGAPSSVKFIVGGCLWLLVFAYLIFAGRGVDNGARAADGSGGGSMKIKDATIAIRPRKNTEITDLAFLFYRAHFKVLAGVAWVLGFPLVALSVGVHYLTGEWWISALLFYFTISIPTGAVVFAASRLVFGTKQTVRQTLAAYRPMWAGLFFRRLGQKLLVLGLAPIVVGYALRLGWVFTPMIVLLERLSGYTLRVRRKGSTGAEVLGAFGMDVILGLTSALLIAGLVLIVELVAGELLATWTGEGLFSGEVFDRPLFMGIWMCAILAVAPFSSLSWFFLYLNARIRGEGWDLELGFRTAASRISRDEEGA